MLSKYKRESVDPPSSNWLGHYSDHDKYISQSLWNSNHVEDDYTPAFVDTLQRLNCTDKGAADYGR